jgi:hypothetical protein
LAAPQQDSSEPPLEKLISRVFVKLPIPVRQFITNAQHVLAEEDFERHKLHVAKRIGQEFIDSGCAGWAIGKFLNKAVLVVSVTTIKFLVIKDLQDIFFPLGTEFDR